MLNTPSKTEPTTQQPRFLEQVVAKLRVKHYSCVLKKAM